jgi:hypothetical protein
MASSSPLPSSKVGRRWAECLFESSLTNKCEGTLSVGNS